MFRAILLDLDNTLLENDMDRFIPAYISSLSQYMSDLFPPEVFVKHLLEATDAMMADTDPQRTNMETFGAAFFPALGRTREELEPLFMDFYAERFPHLRSVTQRWPEARDVVMWALEQGFQVVVATNPLFPLTAIEQRLEWAGVPVTEFSYDLVTSYEQMHATKPHKAYFAEIADRIGRRAEECLMVGDEWEMDILPAQELGMHTYWITAADGAPPNSDSSPSAYGTIGDLIPRIRGMLE